jgi:putative PIN family toxin of toxin-antitoxin system
VRVVLDTNVLVSGVFWKGLPFFILEQWISDSFILLLSEEIFIEYQNVLFRISRGKKDDLVNKWLLLIAESAQFVKVKKRFKLSRDPDDDKFIECAVSGNAQYIVSGDSDLLDLKSVLNVAIVSPSEFLR